MVKQFNFKVALGIISILGFTAILLSSFDVFVQEWVDSLLFITIGFALFVSGGYHLFFDYFKDGLTYNEINKIVSVFLGVASMVLGFLIMPSFNLELEVFRGVKMLVAGIAIFVIAIEMFSKRGR
jgi:hypothetical protein